jgi:hypothetical protein
MEGIVREGGLARGLGGGLGFYSPNERERCARESERERVGVVSV